MNVLRSGTANVVTIATLTLREAVRRRLLWALIGLTVTIVAITGWGFARISELSPIGGGDEARRLSRGPLEVGLMF